jgi:hypothetical protein
MDAPTAGRGDIPVGADSLVDETGRTQGDAPARAWRKPVAAGDEPLDAPDVEAVHDYLINPRALNVPPVESPFFESILTGNRVDPVLAARARAYREQGFLVLEDAVEPELIDAITTKFPWLFDPATVFDAPPFVQELLRLDPNRRLDAWWVCEAVRELACHPAILDILAQLYGREPIPFQTLSFLRGTEQPAHSDAIHFSSIPARFMCGVWVALEDMTEENGPLVYYPGSHRLPEPQLEQLGLPPQPGTTAIGPTYERFENYVRSVVKACGLRAERLTVRKGTALIWASNLLHGGSAIRRAGATRMSQVTHYYFRDCVYYAPIHSSAALGEYRLKPIHDLRTGDVVPHSLNGQPFEAIPVSNGNHRLVRPGEEAERARTGTIAREDFERALQRAQELERERDGLAVQAGELQSERERLAAHVLDVERERERLDQLARRVGAERDELERHAHEAERILTKIHGRAIYRALCAVKDVFVRPGRGGKRG